MEYSWVQNIAGIGLVIFLSITFLSLAFFVWSIFGDNNSGLDNHLRSQPKANADEIDDQNLWLPDFAKQTIIEVTSRHGPGGRVGTMDTLNVIVTQKSNEQMIAEKRAYFTAKENQNNEN